MVRFSITLNDSLPNFKVTLLLTFNISETIQSKAYSYVERQRHLCAVCQRVQFSATSSDANLDFKVTIFFNV